MCFGEEEGGGGVKRAEQMGKTYRKEFRVCGLLIFTSLQL
jgi:hypothetical protein